MYSNPALVRSDLKYIERVKYYSIFLLKRGYPLIRLLISFSLQKGWLYRNGTIATIRK